MSRPCGYLSYPGRRRGMDHDRYDWSSLPQRPKVTWPDGAGVALWVVVSLEWFRFSEEGQPFLPMGGSELPFPDYWGYSQRDYGNRVGVFRLMQVLSELGVRVTAAANSEVCRRYPFVVEEANRLGWELIGHGTTSGRILHGGMSEDEERTLIGAGLDTIRRASGQRVVGWLSPSLSESPRTPDLLAEQGVEYICDWVNDDLPYPFRAGGRTIYAMPYSIEINDVTVLWQLRHRAADFRDLIVEQFKALRQEAQDQGGRTMCVALHPWLIGVPHRISYLQEALEPVTSSSSVWSATGAEILDAFRQQTESGVTEPAGS